MKKSAKVEDACGIAHGIMPGQDAPQSPVQWTLDPQLGISPTRTIGASSKVGVEYDRIVRRGKNGLSVFGKTIKVGDSLFLDTSDGFTKTTTHFVSDMSGQTRAVVTGRSYVVDPAGRYNVITPSRFMPCTVVLRDGKLVGDCGGEVFELLGREVRRAIL